MPIQKVFKRYEMKYLLNPQQKEKMLQAMEPYMSLDQYGRTTIRNLYFDTDTYRLVRHSIEKPAYKEKLRIRSYSQAMPDSTVFVELKKKYKKIVYKRRIPLPEKEAMEWVSGERHCSQDSQISEEIDPGKNTDFGLTIMRPWKMAAARKWKSWQEILPG